MSICLFGYAKLQKVMRLQLRITQFFENWNTLKPSLFQSPLLPGIVTPDRALDLPNSFVPEKTKSFSHAR